MNNFAGLYEIRNATADDRNFILATFLRGVYYGDSWFSMIPKAIFMAHYKKVAEHLVTSARVTIACLKDDPNVIIGYSILSPDASTVHWVFVKAMWRRNGVARSLVPPSPVAFSHLSALGKTIMTKQFPNTVFNPFAL